MSSAVRPTRAGRPPRVGRPAEAADEVPPAERGRASLIWPRLLLAIASGLLASAAFPPYDLWFLSLPAVALLVLLCRDQRPRRASVFGLCHGLAMFVPLLAWMRIIGGDAWIALSLLEASFYAVMAALIATVTRIAGWPLWVACLWVAQEGARALVPFGGFPWGRVAFAQTASPFTPYAALGGAALVTFMTALTAALIAYLIVRIATKRWLALGAGAAALALPAAAMLISLPTAGKPVTAALVQGNVPRPGLHFSGEREQVLRNHVAATNKLGADVRSRRVAAPDLVIWPENASDIDPLRDDDAYRLIDEAVKGVGVPVLVGAVLAGPGPDYVSNVGIVWSPTGGPGTQYVKRHPVPFGEYIPFRAQLSGRIQRLEQIPRDFFAADRPGVLKLGKAVIGDVICFEIAYDGLVRDVVRGGAEVLVVQTNNATYNRTNQPPQQLAMSRLRAVEHGRAVLVAATSGISAVIEPDGDVVERSEELTAKTLVAEVPLRQGLTIADRLGGWPEAVLAMMGLAATVAAAARRRARPGAVHGRD